MKVSPHVIIMLNVGGPFVERVAHLAFAREFGYITDAEFLALKNHAMFLWRAAGRERMAQEFAERRQRWEIGGQS